MTTKELFKEVFNGHENVMTPQVVKYTKLDENSGIEVSYGYFAEKKLWGVTVITDRKHDEERSRCFHDDRECSKYINKIENEFFQRTGEVPNVSYTNFGLNKMIQ